jgi:hypothetical protein
MKLYELAKVVRSKNAGPYHLTFDVMFANEEDFRRFSASGAIDAAWVARSYSVPEADVRIIPYPAANAVKVTIPRHASCGSPEDTDVYGAQQHGPLLELELPDA